MKRILTAIWLAAVVSLPAAATTYYVSSSSGNDLNSGTSQTAPWKTLAKVNATSLAAGDTVLLARGDTWRESLVPASSGTSSSSIYFDAYGSGPAPVITGYQDLSSASWSLISGNLWQTPVSGSGVNNALFGTIWGQKQSSQAAVQHDRDFYFSSGALYIYSAGNPATYYGSIGVITTAAGQLIYINGKSWLQFQHLSLQWFDGFGVNIAGASDHLLFANMESNGMVPSGTLPHGFYVNATSPADINFYNDEAHLNYDGFRFDGSATAITLVNCKGYANRDGGLVDNTGHATYSYSHFYANSIAILNSQDVQGGATDGGNNLPADTPPAVTNFATYPARLTFTVDDVGFAAGTESYIDSLLPLFNERGLKLGMAVVAGYSSGLISEIQGWLAAGHDVNSHSWSHQYYTNLNSFTIRYTGTGTAATLSISGNHLTSTVTGGPGGENLNYDLTSSLYDTAAELVAAINGHGGYTAALDINCRTAAHTLGLADVNSQDIKSATYTALFQKDRLEPDELIASKNWLQTNISGLTNAKVFVYPDGIEDAQTQGWSAGAGYEGARGALSIGLGSNFIYAKGVNIQNITSLALGGLHSMTAQQIDAKVAALIFKASVWGVPYGLFIHNNDLTTAEVGTVLDSLLAHGAVLMTNTQLMDWLASTPNISGTTSYVSAAPGPAPDFHFTKASPVLNAGSNLGSAYAVDLPGVPRSLASSWDIGAYVHLSSVYGTGSGPGSFAIGMPNDTTPPITYGAPTDTVIHDIFEFPGYGGVGTPPYAGASGTNSKGDTFNDPWTHALWCRVTDATLGSGGFDVGSNGERRIYSADSKALIVNKQAAGTNFILPFWDNTGTTRATYDQCHPGVLTSLGGRPVGWSQTNPNQYFVLNSSNATIERWTVTDWGSSTTQATVSGPVVVEDFTATSKCALPGRVATTSTVFRPSANDQDFFFGLDGGNPWVSGFAYPAWFPITPMGHNNNQLTVGGTNYYMWYGFHATTASGPAGASEPGWINWISTISASAGTATVNFSSPHGLNTGDQVDVSCVGTTNPNCTSTNGWDANAATITVTSSTQFTYATSQTGSSTGGLVLAHQVADGGITWTTNGVSMRGQNNMMEMLSYTASGPNAGCQMLDTSTGHVFGDPGAGPTGAVSCPNCVYSDLGVYSHSAGQVASGLYGDFEVGGCAAGHPSCGVNNTYNTNGDWEWQKHTLNVKQLPGQAALHGTMGWNYRYSGRTFKNAYDDWLNTQTVLPLGGVGWPIALDFHGSNFNNNATDDRPLFYFTTWVGQSRTPYTLYWESEIIGIDPTATHAPYRFGHTRNGGNTSDFYASNSIGSVDSTGSYVTVPSDNLAGCSTTSLTCPWSLQNACQVAGFMRSNSTSYAINTVVSEAQGGIVNGNDHQVIVAGTSASVQPTSAQWTTNRPVGTKWCDGASGVHAISGTPPDCPTGEVEWISRGPETCTPDLFMLFPKTAH
ncbi:MAG TPA: polysaccharide deacetylase family protein [Terriglobales bacterium]